MLGQTAPVNHTRDGLPLTGTVTPNKVQMEAAKNIFQPVPSKLKIDQANSVDTIANRLNNRRARGIYPSGMDREKVRAVMKKFEEIRSKLRK